MTRPDAVERATEPRSLQVFDRVPRLIGRRDLIGEKFAAGDLTKSLRVTSQAFAYRVRDHPRERETDRERRQKARRKRAISSGAEDATRDALLLDN